MKIKKITKPDPSNTDKRYWEKVLKSHGLGERQLGLQDATEKQEEEKDDESDMQ